MGMALCWHTASFAIDVLHVAQGDLEELQQLLGELNLGLNARDINTVEALTNDVLAQRMDDMLQGQCACCVCKGTIELAISMHVMRSLLCMHQCCALFDPRVCLQRLQADWQAYSSAAHATWSIDHTITTQPLISVDIA